MKESSSLCDSAADGNWVLKYKRKRSKLKVSPSNENETTSPTSDSPMNYGSTKKKLKHDTNISPSAKKIRGHDGYFYECVECDLGGNLLCCDSCPRTYHLECLNPPLKRAPPGKWQCPRCRSKTGSLKLLGNADANTSKHERTKRMYTSTTSNSPPSHTKVSFKPRSSTQDKSGSNEQGKQSCDGALKRGDLSIKNNEVEKKKPLILHLKKRSTKELSANAKPLKSEVGEPSEEKLDKHGSALKLKKHPSPMDLSPNRSKSRRQNRHRDSKRSVAKKVKYSTSDDDSVSSTEPSTSLDNSESPPKRKPLDGRTPTSSTKKGKKKVKFVDRKHSEEMGVVGDKIMTPHEDQQVDRILGCRLQMNQTNPLSHPSSEQFESANSQLDEMAPPCYSTGPETSHDISHKFHDGTQSSSNGTVEDVCADASANQGGKDHLDNLEMQKERNGKSCESKESLKQERVKKTVSVCSGDQTIIIKDDGVPGENVTASINAEDETSDMPAKKDDKKLPVSRADAIVLTKQNHTAESKLHGKIEEIAGKDNNGIGYEFLVKWVGKSSIHNSWVSESELKILAKRKLENYKAKYGTSLINICKEQWCQPQRVIALRASLDEVEEALIKWCGLPYDECTWERLDEPTVMKYTHLVTQFKEFECQALDKDMADDYANPRNRQELNVLVDQPKELQGGMLFPHQLEALNWLRKCWYKSKNVILADEMGLGKTVSACAFLSSLCCEFKINLPCIVLVPLSTMPNWMAEFASWAPHLNVVEYHGSARARSIIRQYEWHVGDASQIGKTKKPHKFNVLLTTYEMVLVDAAYLRSVSWEVLIVDEGHRLKNSSSKLFSLLNSLSFQHRVLLTGTPLQNNIGEMYNLLNFLQPASFPSLSSFEEKFNDLTTAEKVEELKKLVAPHMLRRLKKDAMQNIPPKTERMVPVELTSIQAEYYRAMLTKNYQVLRNIGKGGAHQSLLNIVMQLRKVCNHPYLISGTEPESGSPEFLHEMRIKASAKLTLLHSMLKILHKDGHRVLIFSQMTKLLDILEDYLTLEFGPKTFERVDGSVSVAERQAAIARFNQDKTRFVFLLSTRSCGLGINLATADTVIIYDSDFNPHADIQAMNRAHRIGQSKRLLVYRLVVRASVEERILQLAKKKLMLDQLFVNKSESQKEVEDIIRWGTEELFRNSDHANGEDSNEASGAIADVDFKHRRRTGGLGDVYEDKCVGSSTKFVWDENAIMKLLDRSNLPSTVVESTDADLDNDMLGTVKSIDWNDELNDDPGTNDDIPHIDDDGCEQASEPKQGAATRAEENEWDKLLRVRWEQYQIEEEASLGRGKRLRKAVSYRETFATLPSEALSEDSDEGDEPKREYTAAGLALKEKYGRLRARQKERIAQRHTIKSYADDKLEEFMKSYDSIADEHALNPLIIVEDPDSSQPSGAKRFSESTTEMRQSSKKSKRYAEIPQDFYARIPGNAVSSKHHSKANDILNSGTPNHLLPVLGLCAPNADQVNSYKNSICGPSMKEQKRPSGDVPNKQLSTPAAVHSREQRNEAPSAPDKAIFPGASEDALRRLNNIIPDSYFPFNPIPPISGTGCDPAENPLPSIASFQGKLGLPSFGLEDNIPLKHMKSIPDIFPNLSLGTNKDYVRNSVPEFPNSSLLPNFMADIAGTSKQKSLMSGLLPGLGLNPVQPIHSAMPENHKKVLDNIMMRAQYASSKFLKRSKLDYWSEDELDALWIGVRRHGRGNWDAMLRDPKLKFLNNRTSEELTSRWMLEEQKIIEEPMSTATRCDRSTSFPGISDAMMSRALNESNSSKVRMEQPKLQSHFTDIQLGSSDILSRFPHVDAANYMNSIEGGATQMPWQDFKHRSTYVGDLPGSTFDKLQKLDVGLVPPFMPNPFMNESIGSLPINQKNNNSIQQSETGSSSRENVLHGVSDGQMNLLHEMQRRMMLGKQPIEMNLNRTNHSNSLLENSSDFGSSKSNKLPHWLQEAVRAPPPKPPERELPATVSAIAQSVCLLLGEQKPAIPPFLIPGPRLSLPKDPRITSKKRTPRKVQQGTSHVDHSKIISGRGDQDTTPSVPPFIEASPVPPAVDCNDGAPPLNLNSPSSSSSSSQGQDELPPAFEESHQTVEGSEAIEATCMSKTEVPDCRRTGFSATDDKASGSHRLVDTPDPSPQKGRLPESDNSATAFSASPAADDAPGTSSRAAAGPALCDDEGLKQENPLDNEGSTGSPEALESRDSDASHSVFAQVVDEDKVDEIISDAH
ncbi:protein CHROMATIN REMODELING 4-like [Phragmites australis]|uniref:protein CHROMATIN REMODELING 4-like n=1 Tax=Phragmites australis TaxID=29695 RepID=UPI002D78B241|nr:protein CHROMATIN REMODELING 4-like [Phragmites australis]XP_062186898.1 protein CHROMATIN REMODELING 4-like [Phragmites australis]